MLLHDYALINLMDYIDDSRYEDAQAIIQRMDSEVLHDLKSVLEIALDLAHGELRTRDQ